MMPSVHDLLLKPSQRRELKLTGNFNIFIAFGIVTFLIFYVAILSSSPDIWKHVYNFYDFNITTSKIQLLETNSLTNTTKIPLILIWTLFHGRKETYFFEKRFTHCPMKCEISNNRSELENADMILFHGCDLKKYMLPEVESWQVKLFMMRESPGRQNHFYHDWNSIPMSYFNTTLTYKNNADYSFRYISMLPLDSNPMAPIWPDELIEMAIKRKTNVAFSLISNQNARSNRDSVIKHLQKYVSVDQFGRGKKSCDGECEKTLIETYYFYLAFENTVCDEYITEKLGRFKRLIVPITLKRSVVPKNIPSDSFIAVDDFCSIEELSNYMKYLMTNTTAYKEYFAWTKIYSPLDPLSEICTLCEDLNNRRVKTSDYSAYKNIQDYFSSQDCYPRFGYRILKDRCDLNKSISLLSNVSL